MVKQSFLDAVMRFKLTRATVFGVCAAATAMAALPLPAQAWWHGGVFVGIAPSVVVAPPPVYYAPPVYYPPAYYPPAYYPPPADEQSGPTEPAPYSYAPPQPRAAAPRNQAQVQRQTQADNRPYGSTCYAGVYVCPSIGYARVGDGCSCPGLGAPSYGSVN